MPQLAKVCAFVILFTILEIRVIELDYSLYNRYLKEEIHDKIKKLQRNYWKLTLYIYAP